MRMFVLLVAVTFATSLSFFASADNARGLLSASANQSEQAALNSRCVKKIALGPGAAEVACLMQKHKGRSA
jgi:hypothetical protein